MFTVIWRCFLTIFSHGRHWVSVTNNSPVKYGSLSCKNKMFEERILWVYMCVFMYVYYTYVSACL